MKMGDIGKPVTISLWSGETVEGWFLGETALGVYVALDRGATNIRFVPWVLIGHYELRQEGGVSFPHRVDSRAYESLQSELQRPLALALDRVDHNRVKRMMHHYRDMSWEMRALLDMLDANRDADTEHRLVRGFSDLAVGVKGAYGALLDEILRSGVRDILLERREQIRGIVSRSTLPTIETMVAPLNEIDEGIALIRERDILAETELGAKPLSEISTRNIVATFESRDEVYEAEGETRMAGERQEPATEPKPRRGRRLRAAAAWLKVATGGGLAATNIAFGAIAGVAAAVPTLGLVTVSAAVAIVGSTATGLNMAADGLDKVGTLLGEQ